MARWPLIKMRWLLQIWSPIKHIIHIFKIRVIGSVNVEIRILLIPFPTLTTTSNVLRHGCLMHWSWLNLYGLKFETLISVAPANAPIVVIFLVMNIMRM